MRQYVNERNEMTVEAREYRIVFLTDKPYVRVERDNSVLCTLFLPSGCSSLGKKDVTSRLSAWTAEASGERLVLSAVADSAAWNRKTCRFVFSEEGFDYGMTVEGEGAIDTVDYFSGWYTGSLRWSSGRFYSGFELDSLFNPEPDTAENPRFSPRERSSIDLSGVPIFGRDHWFFTPPPFCFIASRGTTMFSIGVRAAAGANRFTEFSWEGGKGQFLRLAYEGRTMVQGVYELPFLSFLFSPAGAGVEYDLLTRHCAGLRDAGLDARPKAGWWSRPIVCGWGAQCSAAAEKKLPAPSLAREDFYRRIDARLDEIALPVGTLVIDDKWQRSYGRNEPDPEKWPDLKGFIARMHEKGRRVLLWLKAWDPEGLDPELCVRDFAGNVVSADPTNPGYAALFRETAEMLLSPAGLDADGFKIDFSARIPSGPGCSIREDVWGLELMKRYLDLVYHSAKRAKADALVMTHTPHPYLEGSTDMIRLNDVNTGVKDIPGAMTRRAAIAKAACPSCLIDTDNWPMPDRATWMAYLRLQPQLGVPSLYYLWSIDGSGEKIPDRDFDEIRRLWSPEGPVSGGVR